MINLETTINQCVKNLVDFTKEKICSNIADANNSDSLNMSEEDLQFTLRLVESSVSQALVLGYSDVEAGIKKIKKELNLS
jgi:hypothetical protein